MDSASFNDFYAEMRPRIARFIRARFPFDLAEDLANETMLTSWLKNPETPSDDAGVRQLRSFAYTIAVGHIRNAERKLASEAKFRSALDETTLRIVGNAEDPTYEAVLPDHVKAAVAGLGFDDRQALNLMLVGFKTSEIADILEITPKAASMRLSRAKGRLRAKLGGEEAMGDA